MYTRLQPVLNVQDVTAEKAFYTSLGFHVNYESEDFLALAYDEGILFGLQHAPQSDPAQFQQQMVWQIGTSSVDAVAQRCMQHHIPIIQPVTLQDWGEWTLIVRSPNGYRVVFEGPLNQE
jgi:catechol 2,3-dioxygenase-like lactoylglutathione lyase family enzyme